MCKMIRKRLFKQKSREFHRKNGSTIHINKEGDE